jgi:hypothetical protein
VICANCGHEESWHDDSDVCGRPGCGCCHLELAPEDVYDTWGETGEEDDDEDAPVPCMVCSCLIGDELLYGDTWDGWQVCAGCAGVTVDEEDD